MKPLTDLKRLAAGRESLMHGEYVPNHSEEMASTPGEYEEMPDGVIEGQSLRHIEHSAHRVADASCDQPGHAIGTNGVRYLGRREHDQPTHEEIADEHQAGVPVPQPELGQDPGRRQ